jgi:hypothetical protein
MYTVIESRIVKKRKLCLLKGGSAFIPISEIEGIRRANQ